MIFVRISLIVVLILTTQIYSFPLSWFSKDKLPKDNYVTSRDSVEIVFDGEDIANAAKYVRHKVPEKVDTWKESLKKKIVDRLSDDEFPIAQDRHMLMNSDMLEILDNGKFKLTKQDGSLSLIDMYNKPKTRSKNVKSNTKDFGIKDYSPKESETSGRYSDPFES